VGGWQLICLTTACGYFYKEESHMAKKVAKVCKLQFAAGGAKPGPALASAGINMPQFCTEFNDKTKDRKGDIVPVIITAYEDKSFDFVIKTTPAAVLLKKAAGISKASGTPNTVKAGKITEAQLREIAEYKLPDLNANDVDAAMKIVAGTARNMGITIEGWEEK
jgi:large subunit ribosomal protein L11